MGLIATGIFRYFGVAQPERMTKHIDRLTSGVAGMTYRAEIRERSTGDGRDVRTRWSVP